MEIIFADESTIDLNDMDYSPLTKLGSYKGYEFCDEDELIERAKEAEVLIVNKVRVTQRIMENLPKLRLISVIATGYNNVDVTAAAKLGVTVCNVPGYAAKSVAQHTFALILNLATKIYLYHNDIKTGNWHKSKSFTLLSYPTFNLDGKIIGIIGFGAIGREVAKIAGAFNMNVLVHDIQGIDNSDYRSVELDGLLSDSDIVTLHCPLTDKNHHLINESALGKMKKSAFIINTARGPLIDEEALYQALESGEIAGAGIDVLKVEPPNRDTDLLLKAKNIVLSPHSAWSTIESRQNLILATAANIKNYFEGNPVNVVT